MSKMIQIRNVPDHIHRLLKMRAAEAGMSLSEFLVREVSLIADRPSLNEILKHIKSQGSISPSETSASAVRAEREARF
jgi:antitoxin FitA